MKSRRVRAVKGLPRQRIRRPGSGWRRLSAHPKFAEFMSDQSYTLFETAIGACAIVWSARGICGVQLPEKIRDATRACVLRRFRMRAKRRRRR